MLVQLSNLTDDVTLDCIPNPTQLCVHWTWCRKFSFTCIKLFKILWTKAESAGS